VSSPSAPHLATTTMGIVAQRRNDALVSAPEEPTAEKCRAKSADSYSSPQRGTRQPTTGMTILDPRRNCEVRHHQQ
jgi:hypothetical protein